MEGMAAQSPNLDQIIAAATAGGGEAAGGQPGVNPGMAGNPGMGQAPGMDSIMKLLMSAPGASKLPGMDMLMGLLGGGGAPQQAQAGPPQEGGAPPAEGVDPAMLAGLGQTQGQAGGTGGK